MDWGSGLEGRWIEMVIILKRFSGLSLYMALKQNDTNCEKSYADTWRKLR